MQTIFKEDGRRMQNSRGRCESVRPAFGPENFVSIQPAARSPQHVRTAFRRRDESEVRNRLKRAGQNYKGTSCRQTEAEPG